MKNLAANPVIAGAAGRLATHPGAPAWSGSATERLGRALHTLRLISRYGDGIGKELADQALAETPEAHGEQADHEDR